MNLKLAIGILTITMMVVPGIVIAQDNTDNSTQTATGCFQTPIEAESNGVFRFTK